MAKAVLTRKIPKLVLPPGEGKFRPNPIRYWINSQENSFELWQNKSAKALTDVDRDAYMARAYICDDGFYHYCKDILGFKDMHEPFHSRMCRFVVGNGVPYYFNKRVRYLQAFRGSFKSSILSVGYSTWLLGREYLLSSEPRKLRSEIEEIDPTDLGARSLKENEIKALIASGQHLEGVNIRIGLASESLDLPSDHVQTCCSVMDSPEYIRYFGEHAPRDRGKGAKWGRNGLTSTFRSNKALRDPTIWTISLEAPRTGRHFDVIIPDDLQALLKSSSRLQLRETWRLFGHLFPLMDPPNISYYSEMVGAATRWHEHDIYGRMEQGNENKAKEDRVTILKMPVCTEAEVATCPTIYRTQDIPSLKSSNVAEFASQYLMRPRGSKTTAFQKDWIKYYDPNSDSYRQNPGLSKSYVVMGVDFCWIEASRRNDDAADHSVIEAWRVFPGNQWYLIFQWREQVTRMDTIVKAVEIYKQMGAESIGFAMSDRRHVESDIDRFEHENRFYMNKNWISDLGSVATGDDTNKNRKIIGVLQRPFQEGRVHIPMGLTHFEEEILDCPMGMTDDYLDAFVCAIESARAPIPEIPASIKEEVDIWQRHTEAFLKGRPIYLNGKPVRAARGGVSHRSHRRARNWNR